MWPKWLRMVIGTWVAFDSNRRNGFSLFWTAVVLVLGPLLLPFYLAARPLVEGEKRTGGFFWNAFWSFESLISGLLGIGASVVVIENFLEASRSDLALVKKAEIKAGTVFGFFVGFILFVLGRLTISQIRSALEAESPVA